MWLKILPGCDSDHVAFEDLLEGFHAQSKFLDNLRCGAIDADVDESEPPRAHWRGFMRGIALNVTVLFQAGPRG